MNGDEVTGEVFDQMIREQLGEFFDLDDDEKPPCPDGQHKWIRRRFPSYGDQSTYDEVEIYCEVCGAEPPEDT